MSFQTQNLSVALLHFVLYCSVFKVHSVVANSASLASGFCRKLAPLCCSSFFIKNLSDFWWGDEGDVFWFWNQIEILDPSNTSIHFQLVEISGIEPLTSCLQGRRSPSWAKPPSYGSFVVGPSGLEPPTLRLSVVRSSQLSYGPISLSTSVPSKLNNARNWKGLT